MAIGDWWDEGGQTQLLWSTSYSPVYFVQAWTLDMWKYQTAGAEFTGRWSGAVYQ